MSISGYRFLIVYDPLSGVFTSPQSLPKEVVGFLVSWLLGIGFGFLGWQTFFLLGYFHLGVFYRKFG